jgi:hypothetical protein
MGSITEPNPSTNSIGEYGCFLCSLVSGLSERGYGWDPASFNLLLRSKGAWVGPYKDYIDTANIVSYMPDVFTSFQKIDPWNDIPKVDNLVGENQIVVCRVNAKAIGGTGTHYLYLVGQQKGVALIYDPWRNVTELITKTYGNWGNVLGINIFTVKIKSTVPAVTPVTPPVVETPVTVIVPVTPPETPPETPVATPTPEVPSEPVVVPPTASPLPPETLPVPIPQPTDPNDPETHSIDLFQVILNFLKRLFRLK